MKNPLKSNSKKVIIKIKVDDENFYITSINRNSNSGIAKIIKLTGDPQKAKQLVRQTTINSYIKSINKCYTLKVENLSAKIALFKFNNEFLDIVPEKTKDIINERLEYLKNFILWEDDNFDIKQAFKEKDWKKLRKLKTKLLLLFEKEQEYHKIKNFSLDTYSTFTISVVDARHEVRAEKLRRIASY